MNTETNTAVKAKSVKAKSVKAKSVKAKRGAPQKPFTLPDAAKFTVKEVMAANPGIVCRATIVTRLGEFTKSRAIVKTKETVETGKPGKPATVYMTAAAWNRIKGAMAAAKTRKVNAKAKAKAPKTETLATAAPVDLTPAAPVETPAAPVAA